MGTVRTGKKRIAMAVSTWFAPSPVGARPRTASFASATRQSDRLSCPARPASRQGARRKDAALRSKLPRRDNGPVRRASPPVAGKVRTSAPKPAPSQRAFADAQCDLLSTERPEGRSHLFGEQLRLFPGGEVATLVDLVEVDQIGVDLLRPAARRLEDLAREHREGHREREFGRLLPGRKGSKYASCVLPVQPRGRGGGVRQPIQGDVVEDPFLREATGGMPVEEGAGDLLVAVCIVIEHPGRQTGG